MDARLWISTRKNESVEVELLLGKSKTMKNSVCDFDCVLPDRALHTISYLVMSRCEDDHRAKLKKIVAARDVACSSAW